DPAAGPTPVLTPFATAFDYTQKFPPTEFVSASVSWANGVFTSSPIAAPAGVRGTQGGIGVGHSPRAPDLMVLGDLFGWDDPTDPGGAIGFNGIAMNSSANFLDDASGFWDGVTFPDFASAQNIVALLAYTQDADGLATGWIAGILPDRMT